MFEYIVQDGKVSGLAELELLINIAHWSAFCQELIVFLVLKSVHDSVLTPVEALYGQGREAGVITAADVHLIRRALYIGPMASGYSVTRRQADLLFDLNDESNAAGNDEGWNDLFVKAIGSHMIYPEGVGKGLVPDDFKSREEWAEESRAVGLLLMDFGRNDLRNTIAERLREIDVFGRDAARRAGCSTGSPARTPCAPAPSRCYDACGMARDTLTLTSRRSSRSSPSDPQPFPRRT